MKYWDQFQRWGCSSIGQSTCFASRRLWDRSPPAPLLKFTHINVIPVDPTYECRVYSGLFIYRGYFVLQAQYASQEVYVNRFSSELGQQLRWSERRTENPKVVDRYHVVPLFKLPIKRRISTTKRKHCFIVCFCLVELPVKVVLLYWTMV